LNPNGPQLGYQDPGDPEGKLAQADWLNNATKWPNPSSNASLPLSQAFQLLCHALPTRSNGQPRSFKLSPIVASPGEDKSLGLDWRTFAPIAASLGNPKDANDNVYSTSVP
jgi:hypothetical protein